MAFKFNPFSKKEQISTPIDLKNQVFKPTSTEDFKGKVIKHEKQFPKDLGEEHPMDMVFAEKLYTSDPYIHGCVDKYIDFIMNGGFHVKSEDERAKTIAEDWMEEMQFDSVLRKWIRESLVKGNGYIELGGKNNEVPNEIKVLNASNMFVQRDDFGRVKAYNQFLGLLRMNQNRDDRISFTTSQIAHLPINKLGDNAYGVGIVYPVMNILDKRHELEKYLCTIMRRKANNPYVFIVGDREKGIVPDATDLQQLGQDLEYLNNKHEWTFGPYVEPKVLDTGNMSEKFTGPLDHFHKQLVMSLQVPEVLLGFGNIPEGLADEQKSAFLKRVQSFQSEIEKVLEESVFSRLLRSHGIDAKIEFEWGEPDKREKNEEIEKILQALASFMISPQLREQMEQRLADLMGFEDFVALTPEEQDQQALPQVPGQNNPNRKEPETEPATEKEMLHENFDPDHTHEDLEIIDNLPLQKYLNFEVLQSAGFKFDEFKKEIIDWIESEDFAQRQFRTFRFLPNTGRSAYEVVIASYNYNELLGPEKLNAFKEQLKKTFLEETSVADFAERIEKLVKPGDLSIKVPEITDADGNVVRKSYTKIVPERLRSKQMARTEVVRAQSQASLKRYEDAGLTHATWVTMGDTHVCAYCSDMHNEKMPLQFFNEMQPAHSSCRCNYLPVVLE